jgi:hypothetical protein
MIKNPILLVPALLSCLFLNAVAGSNPKPPAPLKVGAGITVRKPVDIEHLSTYPKRYVGRTVRLEGTVKKVCQGMGCWVEVASARGGSFLAKSLDESVLLPKDCAGQKIVVQGVVTALPAPGAAAQEHAQKEAVGHECPEPSYVVATQGVELMPAAKR